MSFGRSESMQSLGSASPSANRSNYVHNFLPQASPGGSSVSSLGNFSMGSMANVGERPPYAPRSILNVHGMESVGGAGFQGGNQMASQGRLYGGLGYEGQGGLSQAGLPHQGEGGHPGALFQGGNQGHNYLFPQGPTPRVVGAGGGAGSGFGLPHTDPSNAAVGNIPMPLKGFYGKPSVQEDLAGVQYIDRIEAACQGLGKFWELLPTIAHQKNYRDRLMAAVKKGDKYAISMINHLDAVCSNASGRFGAIPERVASLQKEIDTLNYLANTFQTTNAFRAEAMEIIELEVMDANLLTPRDVPLIIGKFLDLAVDAFKKIRKVLRLRTIREVMTISNKKVLAAILKSLFEVEFWKHEDFEPNITRLKTMQVISEEDFPVDTIFHNVNYSRATLQWLIVFYLKVPGYNHQKRGNGFRRVYNENQNPFDTEVAVLHSIPEGGDLVVEEESHGAGTEAVSADPIAGMAVAMLPQEGSISDVGGSDSESSAPLASRKKRGSASMSERTAKRARRSHKH